MGDDQDDLLDVVVRVGEMLPVAFSVFRPDGPTQWANTAYCDLVGLTLEEVRERTLRQAVHGDDLERGRTAFEQSRRGESVEVELRTLHRSGHWLQVVWGLRFDPPTGWVCAVALNVTDERRIARALRHDAAHDPLTGLANRAQVMRRLAGWNKAGRTVAIGIVDVDGFKQINDRLGHRVGDEVLRVLAGRLLAAVGAHGVAGRMGGDEFVVMVPVDHPRTVDDLTAGLAEVSGSLTVLDRTLRLSISAGVTVGRGVGPEQLLHEADLAAYVAKGQGPGRLRRYDDALRRRDARRAVVERRLLDALEDEGVELQLQPIVALADDAVVGVEALARLNGADGLLEAAQFVEVAEGLGVMAAVSQRIRGAALRAARDLPADVALHLNLDSEDLLAVGGLGAIVEMAADRGVPPERLMLELSEVALLRDPELAVRESQAVRARGVRIAIDNFGVGASSLSRISRLPIDVLKVDRSFVAAAREDAGARVVLAAVAGIGPALGVSVVLQGIETEADLAVARELGVTAVQGWLLGVPMSVPTLTDHLGLQQPSA